MVIDGDRAMSGFVVERQMVEVDRNRHRMVHHQVPVWDNRAMDLDWDRALNVGTQDSMMEMVIDGGMVLDWENRLMVHGLDSLRSFDCMDQSY